MAFWELHDDLIGDQFPVDINAAVGLPGVGQPHRVRRGIDGRSARAPRPSASQRPDGRRGRPRLLREHLHHRSRTTTWSSSATQPARSPTHERERAAQVLRDPSPATTSIARSSRCGSPWCQSPDSALRLALHDWQVESWAAEDDDRSAGPARHLDLAGDDGAPQRLELGADGVDEAAAERDVDTAVGEPEHAPSLVRPRPATERRGRRRRPCRSA